MTAPKLTKAQRDALEQEASRDRSRKAGELCERFAAKGFVHAMWTNKGPEGEIVLQLSDAERLLAFWDAGRVALKEGRAISCDLCDAIRTVDLADGRKLCRKHNAERLAALKDGAK
jgi:hypothetical protein